MIQVDRFLCEKVGALGEKTFEPGLYAYVGSAQNNLELRVARHKRKSKRLFWHIDYLLKNPEVKVIDVLYELDGKAEECRIANLLAQNGCKPVNGFGCSDCRCRSHLFHAQDFKFLLEHMKRLIVD